METVALVRGQHRNRQRYLQTDRQDMVAAVLSPLLARVAGQRSALHRLHHKVRY